MKLSVTVTKIVQLEYDDDTFTTKELLRMKEQLDNNEMPDAVKYDFSTAGTDTISTRAILDN